MRIVGAALPHESARGHVTGQALYTDDLAGRYPGVLSVWPVLSPHAHARIVSIDKAAALHLPGVVAVISAEDVPGTNEIGAIIHDEPLLPTVAMYVGHPVAWVLAESEEAARLGAAAAAVEYEPLPAVLTLEQAMAEGSYHPDSLRIGRGEPEAALRQAPRLVEGDLMIGGQEHFYIETQASLACLDETGQIKVISSTQHPTETQAAVARVLGLDRNRVVLQSLRMGGGFGGKETQATPGACVAALGTHLTGRPVRFRLNRELDMVITGKRHPFYGRYRAGCTETGEITALELDLFSNGGWSLDLSGSVMARAVLHTDNAYNIPNVRVTGRVAKTNTASNTAFRGFGGPQGMVVCEEIVDRVARTLGLPPHLVRERNLYREGDYTPYGQPVKDAERGRRVWSELKLESGFEERRAAVAAFNAEQRHVKRGIAITPLKFGISFTAGFLNQSGALVIIYQDGTVQVNHGGTEMGQGLHTKMAQVAAQALGVPLSAIRVMVTSTDKVPNTSATAGSTGSDLNGAAVKDACDTLKQRLAAVAAGRLQAAAAEVVFEDGRVFPAGRREAAVPFAEVAMQAYLERVPLFAVGYYSTPGIHFDYGAGKGSPFKYFTFGAAVTEVEVDGFTGQYRLLATDILHDVGESLNPQIDIGQVEGAFVQGMGWLTSEELVWGEDGRLLTRGASTYKLPTVADVPERLTVRLLPRAAEPGVIYGSKAVGEPPFMLAISVREALRDAVGAFGAGGVVGLAAPATPEAVFWAIERVRRQPEG